MSVGWARRSLAFVAAISIVGSMFLLPASADRGGGGRGRGIAVVESYDATTNQLVLATKHFGVVTLTVAEDAQFGVVGGGKDKGRGGGHGFHLGTEADVVPGARLLNSKVEEGLVTKMLLFLPKVDEGCDEPEGEDRSAAEDGEPEDGDEDEAECPDAEDPAVDESPEPEEPDAPEGD